LFFREDYFTLGSFWCRLDAAILWIRSQVVVLRLSFTSLMFIMNIFFLLAANWEITFV
jgi:hypothetical protein